MTTYAETERGIMEIAEVKRSRAARKASVTKLINGLDKLILSEFSDENSAEVAANTVSGIPSQEPGEGEDENSIDTRSDVSSLTSDDEVAFNQEKLALAKIQELERQELQLRQERERLLMEEKSSRRRNSPTTRAANGAVPDARSVPVDKPGNPGKRPTPLTPWDPKGRPRLSM
ncbi:hypothetical protein HOLleu_27349 [Holothuria leucospilota]|uniref:Uncharacterized protein n=1 Tax=Holothuria leucospilota TaxID=206669 RepID=A0A9Q1H2P2_HOLLE|nr:hypothetical protein HOLleu_27349 [Holothuria leucospilota]